MVGPTEEGSIVAHVQAELSDFDAGMDRAQGRTDKLATSDPTVHVQAAVDEAIAKIDTVDRAVNKLGDDQVKASAKTVAAQAAVEQATKRQAIATDALKLAYQRLDDVQMRDGATSTQIAAGHLAAARAENAEERATLALAAANEVLKRSQSNDSAPPTSQSAPPAAGNGGAAPAGYAAGIAIAVLALLPVMAALAGYVATVTGEFAGMGAAGVLAVLGIKNAMAAGTAAGNVFSGGLHILKGDLDQLSNTAAIGMLVSFQRAVDMIDSSMPSLNGEIKLFSGLLGTTGDIVLSTLISGFKTLLPLFLQGGVYVEQLAVGFQKWTTGGGLAQWARDASVSLPQVANALGSLVHGVVSVIGALQPLGTVMLSIIAVVGNVLTLLSQLGPAFPVIVAGALAAYGAFQLFTAVPAVVNLVSKAVTALGISTDVALGPIGWVAAAIAAVAAVALTASAATNNATQAMDTYTAAVQQDAGVIGEHTKAQAANNLQTSGALAGTHLLGIAVKTLTDATTGNAEAQSKLKGELAAATTKLKASELALQENSKATGDQIRAVDANRAALKLVTEEYQQNMASIKDAIKAYNDIQSALGGTTITTKAQLDAQTALAASYGESLPVYLAAKAAQKQTADQLVATTAAMVQENDASSLLTNALTLLNGGSLSVAQAQTGLAAANNTLIDSFRTNGVVVDGSTKAAVANQQAIQQQVTAAQQAAEAIGKQTGSTAAAIQSYKDSKQAIENQLKAQGDLNPVVQAYIDKLYDIANLKVPPTQIDVDTAAATAKLEAFARLMAQVTASATSGALAAKFAHLDAAAGHADGGTIGLADGGTSGTVYGPGSSTSDSILTRLSLGEEVIKTSSANQGRPFLKMFNQDPARAMGGLMAAGAAAAPAPTVVIQPSEMSISDKSIQAIAAILAPKLAQAIVQQTRTSTRMGYAG